MRMDLRQAAMATTDAYRLRVLIVTATYCVIAVIGVIMGLSWLFAEPPRPPESCTPSGIYRVIVDPKPDGTPYLTVICRNGKSWFRDPNL